MKIFITLFFLLISIPILAQEMAITGDFSLGTGLETGIGNKNTEWNFAPVFSDIEVMINTDNDPLFEFGGSFLIPLAPRMGLGFVPKIKLKKQIEETSELYTTIGAPLFFIGFNMQGGQIELGYKLKISDFFAVFAEGMVTVYARGKDLPKLENDEQPMITQFNFALGVSLTF